MRNLVWLCLGLGLWGCEQTKTADYYRSHPDEIALDLAECDHTGRRTFNCNEALTAKIELDHKKDKESGTAQ